MRSAIDVDDQEPGSRGVTYHRHFDTAASDLVSAPPFEYLQHNDHLFQAQAEQNAIPVTERTFTAEQIEKSRSEYEHHVLDTILEVDFSTVSLSNEATDVLDTATEGDQSWGSMKSHHRYRTDSTQSSRSSTPPTTYGITASMQNIRRFRTCTRSTTGIGTNLSYLSIPE
jgi:hypothetical protein